MKLIKHKIIFNLLCVLSSLAIIFSLSKKFDSALILLMTFCLYFIARSAFLFGKISYYGIPIEDPLLMDAKKNLEITFINIEEGLLGLSWDETEKRFLKLDPDSLIYLNVGDILKRTTEKDLNFIFVHKKD